MNATEREEAIFGAWDGTVSIVGFVFGLLVHHSPESAIAVGGLGGTVSACVSMATGEWEKGDGRYRRRFAVAATMFLATLCGSLIAVWPFFVFNESVALFVAGVGCVGVATWIGSMKRRGIIGYVGVYVTLLLAVGLTLAVVAAVPQSV